MEVLFDCEITNTKPAFSLTGELVFEEIRGFIKNRVEILKKEINNYPRGIICINLFGTLNGTNPSIPFGVCSVNFPTDLESKIESCFDEKTLEFLLLKLQEIKNSLGN